MSPALQSLDRRQSVPVDSRRGRPLGIGRPSGVLQVESRDPRRTEVTTLRRRRVRDQPDSTEAPGGVKGHPRVNHSGLDAGRPPRLHSGELQFGCASYPEWLRDGPDDATATGSPTWRMLVLTPAQRAFSRVAIGQGRCEPGRVTPMGQIRWSTASRRFGGRRQPSSSSPPSGRRAENSLLDRDRGTRGRCSGLTRPHGRDPAHWSSRQSVSSQ